jgi:protein-S-isoprenylcysteine O-methyltransferase Ste14
MSDSGSAHPPGAAARALTLLGGIVFSGAIAYFMWFYLFGLERRPAAPAGRAIAVDTALFGLFALHHSVFARARARRWIAEAVSPHLERAVYVWIASLAFIAVCAAWIPFGAPLWQAAGPARVALRGLQGAGILFTLWAARALDGLSLAGIRQLDDPLPPSGIERATASLQHTGPYGVVRHPIYLGWLLIVWPAPAMTASHLLFAAISTAYLLVAMVYEERSLHQTFGPAYADYARKVTKKMIPGVY